MGEQKTFAILLQKKILPNDDGVLEFFTESFGRITVFARKFARSKKQSEVDYFRVLELVFFQGRNSKTLRSVSTHTVFHGFTASYATTEEGFEWLRYLTINFPIEEAYPEFFRFCCHLFRRFHSESALVFRLYLVLQIYRMHGFLPRFDAVRSDIYYHPISKQISAQPLSGAVFFSNRQRQVAEFLRRSDLSEFLEKFQQFSETDLQPLDLLLQKIEH
ncbi:hypothetical protein CSB37_00435 [bacterium DOLZORAL124_38_8]|nr:MAG: hypothetical protein CSB37_00435 [bacterium DOLZORAL124_38_8]